MPIDRRTSRKPSSPSAATSTPSTTTRPKLGFSRPLTSRISVDLPAPERPIMPVTEPRGTARSMASSATTSALERPAGNRFDTASKETIVPAEASTRSFLAQVPDAATSTSLALSGAVGAMPGIDRTGEVSGQNSVHRSFLAMNITITGRVPWFGFRTMFPNVAEPIAGMRPIKRARVPFFWRLEEQASNPCPCPESPLRAAGETTGSSDCHPTPAVVQANGCRCRGMDHRRREGKFIHAATECSVKGLDRP